MLFTFHGLFICLLPAVVDSAALSKTATLAARMRPVVQKVAPVAKGIGLLSGIGTTMYTGQYAPHLFTNDASSRQFWNDRLLNSAERFWLANEKHVPDFMIDERDPNTGNTAIVDAVKRNDQQLAYMLLRAGANPNSRDSNGKPILQDVIEKDPAGLLLYSMIEGGGDVNTECTDGDKLLDKAFKDRNLKQMKILLRKKAKGNIPYEDMIDKLCQENPLARTSRDLNEVQKVIVEIYRASGFDKQVVKKARNNMTFSFNRMSEFLKKINIEEPMAGAF